MAKRLRSISNLIMSMQNSEAKITECTEQLNSVNYNKVLPWIDCLIMIITCVDIFGSRDE